MEKQGEWTDDIGLLRQNLTDITTFETESQDYDTYVEVDRFDRHRFVGRRQSSRQEGLRLLIIMATKSMQSFQ